MLLALSLVLVLVLTIAILVLVLNNCKKDSNGVYSFCTLKSCKTGYVQVGNECKQNTDCQGSDIHGIYKKDSSGTCVLSDCVNGWGLNKSSCVQDGSSCEGGSYVHGTCKPSQTGTTCEQIDPSVCGNECVLPFPVVEVDANGQYTYTKSKTPTKNFLHYVTIAGQDGKYCKLDSCKNGTKNQWWCDSNDCDSTTIGSFEPGKHLPDSNAYWTYMYMHDPPKEYCVFQKCKDYYHDNGSICIKGECIEGVTENCPNDCTVHKCENGKWSDCYCPGPECCGF